MDMMLELASGRRALTKSELRAGKARRSEFASLRRRPITVVLDGVRQGYNIGAVFRLCDAFLVERLIVCGTPLELRKRRLVQAARGAQHWVPCENVSDALEAVEQVRASGASITVVEQAAGSTSPDEIRPPFPTCVVLGAEASGVSPEIVRLADTLVSIPMHGMGNSINVASAAAITLHRLSVLADEHQQVSVT